MTSRAISTDTFPHLLAHIVIECPLAYYNSETISYPCAIYSHLSNKHGGWNKRGGGAKVAKSLNVEAGINVEGGIFWKILVHKSNKRGEEGGKI